MMKKGKFDLAHEGTLFLDEIGDMSLKAQSKTLRILQEQKFERVGGSRTIQVDVRVIAATNKDLEKEIEKGNFRDDLYYRLNVVPIKVPPLRERLEDISSLVNDFMSDMFMATNLDEKEFSGKAIDMLKNYNWPGNIRELKNLVERLIIMTRDRVINVEDIPYPYNLESRDSKVRESFFHIENFREARAEFEKAYIADKLKKYRGNISQTAESIGIERSNLHKKISSYGLDDFKPSQ
jgi:two-component system nitrogen regulation response regulator NtrX